MVEGPEIRNMISQLKYIIGKILIGIKVTPFSRYRKGKIKNIKFIDNKETIKDIFVIGKKIFIILKSYIIVLSMGMEGLLEPIKDPKYNSLEFELKNGKNFYMNDYMKFGIIQIEPLERKEYHIKRLGYDPITHSKMTPTQVYNKFIKGRKSTKTVGEKLLDQSLFAGLGNYLRAEVIWGARINPLCKFNSFSKKNWIRIIKAYKKMYKKAYAYKIINKKDRFRKFVAYKRTDRPDIIGLPMAGRTLWYSKKRIKYDCKSS